MDSTFSRALVGFLILTGALTLLAYVALWAIGAYAGGNAYASIGVVLIAMVAEICVYASTLHEPIYDWIKEPSRRKAT